MTQNLTTKGELERMSTAETVATSIATVSTSTHQNEDPGVERPQVDFLSRRFFDDDDSVDLCKVAEEVEHKYHLKRIAQIRSAGIPDYAAFSSHQGAPRRKDKKTGFDLRGWRGEFDDSPLPEGYCIHCRCPEDLCHNIIFGHYCELRSFLFIGDGRRDLVATSVQDFEEDQQQAYNQYLNVKTFEALSILDGYNEYSPPKCLKDGSMARMLSMFLFKRYEQLGRGFVHHA